MDKWAVIHVKEERWHLHEILGADLRRTIGSDLRPLRCSRASVRSPYYQLDTPKQEVSD